ncbi:hypothetical protein BJX96DRAFT_30191 [Aspergillus floccosus]
MRPPGRGRHAPSFLTKLPKLHARLSFRRRGSVHTNDRAPQSSSTLTSAETLTSLVPRPDHHGGQNSCLNCTSPRPPARPISPVQSLTKKYQFPAVFQGCNPTKTRGLMVLDTGAEINVMSSDMANRLGLPLQTIEPHNLVPVHSDGKGQPGLTVQYEVEVDWHFLGGTETYITRFVVLDMSDYDILLGQEDIWKYQLLVPGQGLPLQWGINRSLEEGQDPFFQTGKAD